MQKPSKKPGRHSLVWRLFAGIAGCTAGLLVMILLLNSFALRPYYLRQKTRSIEKTFFAINGVSKHREMLAAKLEYLRQNDTVSVVIWENRQILYSSQNEDRYTLPADLALESGAYILDEGSAEGVRPFIVLYGRLDNESLIMLRTPIAAIEESIGITNRFLLICGGVAMLLAIGLAFLLARGFIHPIRRLSKVAENVAQLDFSDQYTDGGDDELAALGRSIDAMSRALERTIGDLKNANLQLTADIERTNRQNEAHRAFIANVSHELKTPLALIGTYAEGLREGIAGNREEYCAVIEDEAQKMTDMLRRMNLLMQLTAGSEQLTVERFNVTELLYNLMTRLAPQCPDTAQLRFPEGTAMVWADSDLIENVLTNFLTNAFHHVSPGGTVEGTVTAAAHGSWEVAVRNTGAHIPEAELSKIWDSFYKVDKARTRAYGGSGIGLSVVAAIMRAHRMPYGVRNLTFPDGGTAVEFYIELESR